MSRKRSRISRGAIIVIILAILLLAFLFLGWSHCGLGQTDSDERGTPSAETERDTEAEAEAPPPPDAPPPTCSLRVASDGTITADDRALSIDEAVAHCDGAREANLDVAGDAPFGAAQDLRAALERASIPVQ